MRAASFARLPRQAIVAGCPQMEKIIASLLQL
jgi:hypothetical protein